MKQITIDDLIPSLKKGWVAMDKNGRWNFFYRKPTAVKDFGLWGMKSDGSFVYHLPKWVFNIAPYQGDWKQSLRRIK